MREAIEERPEHDQAGARPAAPARPRPGPSHPPAGVPVPPVARRRPGAGGRPCPSATGLLIVTPGGLDEYFAELSAALAANADTAQVRTIQQASGIARS
jgi:hypothetical protein